MTNWLWIKNLIPTRDTISDVFPKTVENWTRNWFYKIEFYGCSELCTTFPESLQRTQEIMYVQSRR